MPTRGAAPTEELAALETAIAAPDEEITASGLHGSVTPSGRRVSLGGRDRAGGARTPPTFPSGSERTPLSGGCVRTESRWIYYRRAAPDALHFSKLIDRFVQNLRGVTSFEVQYFTSVDP